MSLGTSLVPTLPVAPVTRILIVLSTVSCGISLYFDYETKVCDKIGIK